MDSCLRRNDRRVLSSFRPSSIVHRSVEHGFTLIELLVTAAILGIISLAIVSSFTGGLKVYERIAAHTQSRPDVLLSLEKMERDIRNAVISSEIDFIGEKGKISFAGLTKEGKLGRIYYYVRGIKDTLTREEQDYYLAVSEPKKEKGAPQDLVSIRSIDFSYYYFDPDTGEYKWKDSWKAEETTDEGRPTTDEEKDRVPLGVKIKLTYKENSSYVTLTRTVLIPVGYRGPRLKDDT